MTRRIQLKILPNGEVKAEISGFRGKQCVEYISVLEALLDAETIESERTAEYWLEETTPAQTTHHGTEEIVRTVQGKVRHGA